MFLPSFPLSQAPCGALVFTCHSTAGVLLPAAQYSLNLPLCGRAFRSPSAARAHARRSWPRSRS
jgi:hypothetical protein